MCAQVSGHNKEPIYEYMNLPDWSSIRSQIGVIYFFRQELALYRVDLNMVILAIGINESLLFIRHWRKSIAYLLRSGGVGSSFPSLYYKT